MQEDRRDEEAHRDERGSEPPSEGGIEDSQDGRGEGDEPTPGEDAGPLGNPESDEEALSHRQQEADSE